MPDRLDMTEAEEKALTAANKIYENVFRNMLEQWSETEQAVTGRDPLVDLGLRNYIIPGLFDKDGFRVRIPLKAGWQNKHTHLWYLGEKGHKHCYTPWKDTKGRYWTFTLIPKGKGSRSGSPERWALRDPVSFTTRKAADARALKRSFKGIDK